MVVPSQKGHERKNEKGDILPLSFRICSLGLRSGFSILPAPPLFHSTGSSRLIFRSVGLVLSYCALNCSVLLLLRGRLSLLLPYPLLLFHQKLG